jgi:hypothetical protein
MPTPGSSSGARLKYAGFALVAAGAALILVFGPEHPIGLLGGLVMLPGLYANFRGRQLEARALVAGPDSPLTDDKADVLYLRSFTSDPSTLSKMAMSAASTEEEELAAALRPIGDLIAIGQPGESLPLPGAARMYASDETWRQRVSDRMSSAALVVLRVGTGHGLIWECGEALSRLRPEQLVILILDTKLADYRAFASEVESRFKLRLPEVGATSLLRAVVDVRENPSKALPGVILFSSGWRPSFRPLPFSIVRFGNTHLRRALAKALAPVLEALGTRT